MQNPIIFVGSTHSFLDDFSKQKEIINLVNPEFILSEDLENLVLDSEKNFKDIFNKKIISQMTSFEEVKRLIELCYKKNIKLIGMDFKNFGFNKEIQTKIKGKKKLSASEEKEVELILKKRERKHLSKILEYTQKTSKPILVILGCWHLRKDSYLRKKLKSYKIIAPLDSQGEILFEPTKKRKIKYGEIIYNGN